MARREGTKRISIEEIRVFLALSEEGWSTTTQLAKAASVSRRTAQTHARHLAEQGVAECRVLSPAYLYRRTQSLPKNDYAQRLRDAAEAVENTG